MPVTLGELATRFGCELIGDPDVVVDNLASLASANERSLTFLSSDAYRPLLAGTRAAAVIVKPADAETCPAAALLDENPYACYARMAPVVRPEPSFAPGRHASAAIADDAVVAASAHIAAHAVVDSGSDVGENVYIGPGCVVGPDCVVGDDARLIANVTLVRRVRIGRRSIIHPGAVIGSDGFGNAQTPDGWIKVPQYGGVIIGDDVEIGANTTVDCGALDDTIIQDGVRIDNLCMIAHNVHVGAHTAMAAMSGIAGSAVIGKRCIFGGQAGSAGHVTICDDVVITAQGSVTKDITKPGVYASIFPSEPAGEWSRKVGYFRRLDSLNARVRKLEKGES